MHVIPANSKVGRFAVVRPRIIDLLTVSLLLVSASLCQETSKTMTMFTTRLVEQKSIPGSFSSEAKTCWRAGTKYARVAEAPDARNRIHELVVVSEPDVWIINLFDKSGKHIVDSGPTFEAELPIFD